MKNLSQFWIRVFEWNIQEIGGNFSKNMKTNAFELIVFGKSNKILIRLSIEKL